MPMLGEDMNNLSYEEKMGVIVLIRKRLDKLEMMLEVKRIKVDKECPHRRTVNMTTLADLPNVEKRLCLGCNAVLVYEDGVFKRKEER